MLLCMFVGTAWAEVNPELSGKYAAIGEAATEVVADQWYVLFSHGRNSCVSEETNAFKMRQLPASGAAENMAGKLFKITAAESGKYYIQSGNGLYFDFKDNNTSSVSEIPVAYNINTIGENAGHFYIQHAENGFIADGQEQGNGFVCWSTNVPTNAGGNNCYHLLPVTLHDLITVTYNFTYNSEVKYTQETVWVVGAEFPEITTKFPIGVSSAAKPAGTVTADNAEQTIALSVDDSKLPFIPAASFETVSHWYYMNIRDDGPTFAYYDSAANFIPADKSAYDENNRDAYTWAFVGNPIDGFSIVNLAAGSTMVLSSPAVPTGNTNEGEVARMVIASEAAGNKVWTIMSPTHGGAPEGAFYIQHPTAASYAINRQGIGGKNALAYWTGRDTGSSVQVIERLMGVAPQIEPLINEAEELLATVQANIGTQIGEYSQEAADALSAAIAVAKAVTEETYTEAASEALQAAIDATKPVMPTVGKYYQFHSSLFAVDKAVYSTGSQVKWKTLNASDKSFFWQAVATANGGVAFMNVADGKYLNGNATESGNWAVSDNAVEVNVKKFTSEAAAKGYEYGIVLGGWEMHCAGHNGGAGNEGNVVSWNTGSAQSASAWYIVEVELPVFYTVTYQFLFEGNVKYSTTVSIAEGADFPELTIPFLPYGVSAANLVKPEGQVTKDVVVEFNLTKVKELPVKAVANVESINTWYFIQLHGNTATRAYIEDNGGAVVDWNDKSVADEEIDSHLWGFVGDVFGMKMVNKKTGKAIASTGSGNATMAEVASATAFVVTASRHQSDPWFCMKYPTNNNYLNAQGDQSKGEGCIKHWSDNDNGSSFFATEYNKVYEVNVNEYATLYLGYQVAIPEGVKAYVVSETTDASAKMTEVTGSLPAYTAVILKGNGAYDFVTSADAPAAIASNELRGSVVDTYVEGAAYVLSNKDKGLGFYTAELNLNADGAEGTTHFKNNAFRAYLPVPAAGARFLSFDFGTETAIESIEGAENAANAVIYDLSGRRVQKAQKGLYIVNGAIVIK